MFANDTSLFRYVQNNIQQAVITVNKYLDMMHKYFKTWLVITNSGKTVFILFSSKISPNSVQLIYYGNIRFQQVESHKHLGLILTPNKSWSKHISTTLAKSN